MSSTSKKMVSTSLTEDEIEALDRVSERQQLSRAEALREAVRWYISAMRSLPPAVDPLADEIEAIEEGQRQIARGESILLDDLKNEMGSRIKPQRGARKTANARTGPATDRCSSYRDRK